MLCTDTRMIKPREQEVNVGGMAKYTCKSHFPREIKWFFNNGPLPNNCIRGLDNIVIFDAVKSNEGYYECLGRLNQKKYPWFAATGQLLIRSKLYDIITKY